MADVLDNRAILLVAGRDKLHFAMGTMLSLPRPNRLHASLLEVNSFLCLLTYLDLRRCLLLNRAFHFLCLLDFEKSSTPTAQWAKNEKWVNKELLDKCKRANKIAPLWHMC